MAGLDPSGRREFLSLVRRLRAKGIMTIVYLSASLDEVTSIADYIYVLDAGAVAFEGTPADVLGQLPALDRLGVGLSSVSQLALALATVAPKLASASRDLDTLEAMLLAHLTPAKTPSERGAQPSEEATS
jgi:ABC-type multidrug transport system ATPase subunit